MKCQSCGADNETFFKLCWKCGQPLPTQTPAASRESSTPAIPHPDSAQRQGDDTSTRNGPTRPIVTLSCPTCGGKLQITSDLDRFACAYCGQEHIVQRGAGTVSLKPVLDELKNIRASVDRSASASAQIATDLKVNSLRQEIAALEVQKRSKELPPQTMSGLGSLLLIGCIALYFGLSGSNTSFGSTALTCGVISLVLFILAILPSTYSQSQIDRQIKQKKIELNGLLSPRCAYPPGTHT